jgi:phosphohistidine swiveling domain-containing protein
MRVSDDARVAGAAPGVPGRWQLHLRGRSRFHLLECWLDSFHVPQTAGMPGCDARDLVAVGRDGEWSVHFGVDDVARLAQDGLAFVGDREAVRRFAAGTVSLAEGAQAAARDCRAAVAAEGVPGPAGARSIAAFFAAYTLLQGHYQGTSALYTAGVEARLKELLRRDDALATITYGDPRPLVSFRESMRWRLLLLAHARDPFTADDLDRALREHVGEFAFVGALSDRLGADPMALCRERWARDVARPPAEHAAELDRVDSAVRDGLDARERLRRELRLDEHTSALADGLASLGVQRLAIREEFTRAAHAAYPAFAAVFATVGDGLAPGDGVRQLSRDEVVALAADEPVDLEVVRQRLRLGAVRVRDGAKRMLTGAGAHSLLSQFDLEGAPGAADGPLTGLAVSGEKPVVGRARVLTRQQSRAEQLAEAERAGPGEILVVAMTYPALVPVCSRVAGIITDFGGLTCHAAVIARASGVPCIVGTKQATTRLRTGDLVRLDPLRSEIRLVR